MEMIMLDKDTNIFIPGRNFCTSRVVYRVRNYKYVFELAYCDMRPWFGEVWGITVGELKHDWKTNKVINVVHNKELSKPFQSKEEAEEYINLFEIEDMENNGYVYIIDYCTGRIICHKIKNEELFDNGDVNIDMIFNKYGTKEGNCHILYSPNEIEIEYESAE